MAKLKNFFQRNFGTKTEDEEESEYLELSPVVDDSDRKALVKPYTLNEFSDLKAIISDIREGYIIEIINIKPLKEKDVVELKRAISKLKSTVETLGGDIAGVFDDLIVVTPSFAQIDRTKKVTKDEEDKTF